MMRPKFENVIELNVSPAPLWVIDYNVMTHDILYWYQSKIEGSFSKEIEAKLVKGAWALFVNRGPQFLPRHSYRTILVADYRDPETSNYWRDQYMQESEQVQQAWRDRGRRFGGSPPTNPPDRDRKAGSGWPVSSPQWALHQA